MTLFIEPLPSLTDAWVAAQDAVRQEPDARAVNLVLAIADPTVLAEPDVVAVVDRVLAAKGHQSVATVANTLFPQTLYRGPDYSWSPSLSAAEAKVLDDAAAQLYSRYGSMLSTLRSVPANKSGTYFSRMMSWPGLEAGGVNQLADRIKYLRLAHGRGQQSHNASDIAVGGEAELAGLQIYAATDRRQRAFPCLVHVDLTLDNGLLHMSAVYRHWYMVQKGLGNLIGLARVQAFLAQQTGFAVGELVVTGTMANAQKSQFGGARGLKQLSIDLAAVRPAAGSVELLTAS